MCKRHSYINIMPKKSQGRSQLLKNQQTHQQNQEFHRIYCQYICKKPRNILASSSCQKKTLTGEVKLRDLQSFQTQSPSFPLYQMHIQLLRLDKHCRASWWHLLCPLANTQESSDFPKKSFYPPSHNFLKSIISEVKTFLIFISCKKPLITLD